MLGRIHRNVWTTLLRWGQTLSAPLFARPAPQPDQVRRILILHTQNLGDMIVATPLFRALDEHFQPENITILTTSTGQEVLRHHPRITQTLIYNETQIHNSEYLALLQSLKQNPYDLTIDLQFNFTTLKRVLLPALLKTPYRLGYTYQNFKHFGATQTIPALQKHGAEYFLDLARALHCPIQDTSFELHTSPEENKNIQNKIKSWNIPSGKKMILLHPFSSTPLKSWKPDHWCNLALTLQKEPDIQLILTGVNNDALTYKALQPALQKGMIDAVGQTSIRELLSLFHFIDGLICVDTSVVHIAAAFHTPTVALYGVSYLCDWTPWNTDCQTLLTKYPECKICTLPIYEAMLSTGQDLPCHKNYACIQEITPEEVIAALKKQLQTAKKPIK